MRVVEPGRQLASCAVRPRQGHLTAAELQFGEVDDFDFSVADELIQAAIRELGAVR